MADRRKAAVLVVDQNARACRVLADWLNDRGHAAVAVDSGEKAFNRLDAQPWDALVAEFGAQRVNGERLARVALSRYPDMCVVLSVTEAQAGGALALLAEGVQDYLVKPMDLPRLDAVLRRGFAFQDLRRERVEMQRRLDEQFGLMRLTGRSGRMLDVYRQVRHAAPLSTPVLVCGEPGSGKEIAAEAIHTTGPRRDAPMVKADAAALPAAEQARALFGGGHREGLIETAEDGTFFLDNVEALCPEAQELLTRWLASGKLQRAGTARELSANARLIAATRGSPAGLRGDDGLSPALAEALSALVVEMPPLRRRPQDIPLLVREILDRRARAAQSEPRAVSPSLLELLARYDWPGNVRELEAVLEGMDVSAAPGPLGLDIAPPYLRKAARPAKGELRVPLGVPMAVIERAAIEETLRHCDYDKAACARMLGIGLRTLYRKLAQYGDDNTRV